MKRLAYIMLIVLFYVMMASCAKADSESADEMINPGDKIGDFLITTSDDLEK